MMLRSALIATAALLSLAGAAVAQEMTASSLLKGGYELAGIIPSNAGTGIFLKDENLIGCFVAEKPGSTTIATNYCKPVR